MKREEIIAKEYFESIGYNNLVYEPNGNRTPDFLINKNIAVEVRRLNQFYNNEPIEKVKYKLIPKIVKQIESFESENYFESAFVGIEYSRPIKYNSFIKNRINSILKNHSSNMKTQKEYVINDNLKITIIPSEIKLKSKFSFGSSIDFNEGGFVLGNIYNSLKFIVKDKYKKIEYFKPEYKTWWLALVDFIGNGVSENEILQLRESIDFDLLFDKVFIISYLNPKKGTEI